MKSVCEKLRVRGYGAKKILTAHDLRATMVELLIDAGYEDSTIMLVTLLRNIFSLRNYHNFLGKIGLQQVSRMLGTVSSKLEKEVL